MTREEAIEATERVKEIIEECTEYGNEVCCVTSNEADALNMAIKALEQEPCNDAVSKTSVFEIMGNLMSIPYDFDRPINEKDVSESMDEIRALPSVTPIHKDRTVQDFVDKCRECGKQRWIPCSERLPNESGKYWCTFSGTNLMGIDFYTTESYAKKWFDEPEEYIGWESKNVSAWMPLPEPYKESEE